MTARLGQGAANPVYIVDEQGKEIEAVNPLDVSVVSPSPLIIKDDWEVFLYEDELPNDNDKTIPVPTGQEWQILWLYVEYASDGNAGNRQIEVDLLNGEPDVIGQFRAGTTQAASETRYYMFAPSLADLTAFRDTDYLMTPLPPTIFLPAGYGLRIFDNNNVSAGDDMQIQMMVARRNV